MEFKAEARCRSIWSIATYRGSSWSNWRRATPAIATTERFAAEGTDVRYLRSVYVPSEAHCMCLFEAPDSETVRAVNETAQIPFTRVTEAMDLTP